MKKRLMVLAAITGCMAILATGSLAYFTADDTARNVITTSGVDIAIEEWQETEDGLVEYPKDEPIEVMPGAVVSKIVTVRNAEAESYIRAKFEIVVTDADGEVMEIAPETLESVISVAVNEESWQRKEGDDEWWYYTTSVETDAVTEPLFTEVVFDGPNMTNEYQNCTVEVNVDAQAVQTAHNGENVMEAAGWPAE